MSRIRIKPENKGKLRSGVRKTKRGTIPVATLRRMKNSRSAKTRKRATFALNARGWSHR